MVVQQAGRQPDELVAFGRAQRREQFAVLAVQGRVQEARAPTDAVRSLAPKR
ncbi:hypothetical protein ACIQPT_14435 [Streptomyces sp. NPDC091289]|uniref:hypothetical protein n=1 Tax=Streptomyces sp. NPDC091289 TaxID=3365989 RepID=UPI00382E088B